eukprot:1160958-Pelagomonas_calceolata.AAC.3
MYVILQQMSCCSKCMLGKANTNQEHGFGVTRMGCMLISWECPSTLRHDRSMHTTHFLAPPSYPEGHFLQKT